MNEIFNPSLIISLGPSGGKALDFSKKLLSCLPKYLLDVIDYYNIGDIDNILKDIQAIIDNKLLSAKYLNRLVDLGYKVRNENIGPVKVNLYLFWDVYNCDYTVYEILRILSNINYGNIDADQHSGVSLYIIPLMEKEWILDETGSLKSIEKLEQIIAYVSEEESMLSIDSKVYMLHCISNDGTRIPMQELEYICGILTYLNVLPSEDPPLSHFNKRLMMNEGKYKIGTVGITTLTIFKDKLLQDFSKYMAIDIMKHASQSDSKEDFSNMEVFHLIGYDAQKNMLKNDVNITEEDGHYKLSNIEKYNILLPKDRAKFPRIFKNWEEFIENHCLTEIREIIDKNSDSYIKEVKQNIDDDLRHITLNNSLKEGISYLNALSEEIAKQKPSSKSSIGIDTSILNRELRKRVDNCPNLTGYIAKCFILAAFFLYSMINIVIPMFSTALNIVIFTAFFGLFFIVSYLDYWFTLKRLNAFIKRYKEEIFRRSGSLANLYIEKNIADKQKEILGTIYRKIKTLQNCIENCELVRGSIVPVIPEEEENLGDLIVDLLDFNDRAGFYIEKAPRISDMYRKFLGELGSFEEFEKDYLRDRLIEFSLRTSPTYIDLDFFEYIKFKYKDRINEELSEWITKGIVKSKYLLQYINNDLMEEHSLFITSPEVYRIARDMKLNDLSGFNVSIVQGRDVYTNCISIIKLCLGIDLESVTPIKKLKRGMKSNDSEEQEIEAEGGEM